MSSSIGNIFSQITYPKAIGLSLLVGGLYYQVYDDGSKLKSQIADIDANIMAEEEKKKETDKIKAEEKAIKDEVGALAEKFKDVTARFPINLKSDEIISTINTIAASVNVRVTSVKKESIEPKDLYEEIPLSLEFSGTFNNLLLLMFRISTLEKVTNLGDFEFSNEHDNYDGLIKLSTRIIGYKYKKPPDIAPGSPTSDAPQDESVADPPPPPPASGNGG